VDANDVVRPGKPGWQPSYEAIRAYRVAQLDTVLGFAQAGDCRMARLVRHFGETRDTEACGMCDACQPAGCLGRQFCEANAAERSLAERIVEQLEQRDGLATGTLMRELLPGGERRAFDRVLDALERGGAISLREDEFEKDGKVIRFRRVDLLANAREIAHGDNLLFEVDRSPAAASPRSRARPKPPKRVKKAREPEPSLPIDRAVEERLRQWRQSVAKARGMPAFLVMNDKTLVAIACATPRTTEDLLQVRGAGPKLVKKHGEAILRAVRS
jgi:superfamily II DNA helicase RecQ